jgi:hypothetical protein
MSNVDLTNDKINFTKELVLKFIENQGRNPNANELKKIIKISNIVYDEKTYTPVIEKEKKIGFKKE